MKEEERDAATTYDRLEAMFAAGVNPQTVDDPENADILLLMTALSSQAPTPDMPRADAFRKEVMTRVRGRKRGWLVWGSAVAAVLVLAFLIRPTGPVQDESAPLVVDREYLNQAMENNAKLSMIDYLQSTERLLLAMRDYHVTCSEDQLDFAPEKELAKSLLIQQKLFSPQMNRPEFYQARSLFSTLERILVDVNNLDNCSDAVEVEFINRHIYRNRILNKLRVVAQDIQIT